MHCDADCRYGLADIARDPMVRLVMASDGVTEADFLTLLETAQRAISARTAAGMDTKPAIGRPRTLRLIPNA